MEFYKFQCLGNDYIVVKEVNNIDYKELAIKLCNRHTGVGALGLIVIKDDYSKYTCYDYNGNIVNRLTSGLCEYFEYIKLNGIKVKNKMKFISSYSEIEASLDNELVNIKLGKPIYKNQMLGINDSIDSFGRLLQVEDAHYTIYSLFLGEIYTIIFVDDLNDYICNNGNLICDNKLFKKKTNVCFVKKIDSSNIKVKVYDCINGYEQFSLLAGACASAVGKSLEILDNDINVHFENGSINVCIDRKENILINAKSNLVFIGKLGDGLNA